ncbi:hypothetical protein [uncultured Methanofollis sp.]|uniref:hypothetical protein n=1 Tax=uncultured Methanofollis sp. TaxID=262500 RepID=UPI00262DD4EC|nr:hypothetical protein [uncultured Methanofollis sp.]
MGKVIAPELHLLVQRQSDTTEAITPLIIKIARFSKMGDVGVYFPGLLPFLSSEASRVFRPEIAAQISEY